MDDVEKLLRDLRSKDYMVRWKAADGLQKIGKPAVPTLVEALGDEDSDVRFSAAWALVGIDDPSIIPVLINALGDANGNVRYLAIEALEKIGKPAVLALSEALGDADVRLYAVWALTDIIRKADAFEDVEKVEAMLKETAAALSRKDGCIEAMMSVAKLMRRVSGKKNELASKRDMLLDAKPKPPKRGSMYLSLRKIKNR